MVGGLPRPARGRRRSTLNRGGGAAAEAASAPAPAAAAAGAATEAALSAARAAFTAMGGTFGTEESFSKDLALPERFLLRLEPPCKAGDRT